MTVERQPEIMKLSHRTLINTDLKKWKSTIGVHLCLSAAKMKTLRRCVKAFSL
jgi:hypothetical protein